MNKFGGTFRAANVCLDGNDFNVVGGGELGGEVVGDGGRGGGGVVEGYVAAFGGEVFGYGCANAW